MLKCSSIPAAVTLLLGLLAFLPGVGAGEPAALVAVFDVENNGTALTTGDLRGLSVYLSHKMGENGDDYRVVPREEIRKKLQGQKGGGLKSCFDQACQIQIGRDLAAQYTVHTSISKMGNRCVIAAALFDLNKGATVRTGTSLGTCNIEELISRMDGVAKSLTSKAPPTESTPQPQPQAQAQPQPQPQAQPQPQPQAQQQPQPQPKPQLQAQHSFDTRPDLVPNATKSQSDGNPADVGNAGIITGLIFDCIGYITLIVSGALVSEALGVSIQMDYSSALVLTVGAAIGTISYTVKTSAYKDAGYDTSQAPLAYSWTLTGLTFASFGASVALSVVASQNEDFGMAIGSLCCAFGAAIFEIWNWLSVRNNWSQTLAAAKKTTADSSVEIVPVFYSVRNINSSGNTGIFGFAVRF